MAVDANTFGYRWDSAVVKQSDSRPGPLVKLPEYYRLVKRGAKPQWIPVRAEDVPAETGLTRARFDRPSGRRPKTYVTPEDAASTYTFREHHAGERGAPKRRQSPLPRNIKRGNHQAARRQTDPRRSRERQ